MSGYISTSPYFTTNDTGSFLDVISFRNIPLLVEDEDYEVLPPYEARPDLLAYDLYGDPRLWWVFAVRNKDIIRDPIFDMVSGVIIKLPKLETLKKTLGI